MKKIEYMTSGTCAKKIEFELDDESKLHNVQFFGGCPGNLAAIPKIIEGMDASKVAGLLKGNPCGNRGTSCADQLAIAIEKAIA